MILNSDGSVYRTVGSLQNYDPKNPDLALFSSFDEEQIELYGSPILYYECLIQFQSLDKLYLEDRSKIFSPKSITLFALYEPVPSQQSQGIFGIDGLGDNIFEVNYNAIVRKLGHIPKVGSRILTPLHQESWVIVQINGGEYRNWSQLRLTIICQKFQENITTEESKMNPINPLKDFSATN